MISLLCSRHVLQPSFLLVLGLVMIAQAGCSGRTEQTSPETDSSKANASATDPGEEPSGEKPTVYDPPIVEDRGEEPSAEELFGITVIPTVQWLPEQIGVPESAAETEADMKAYTEEIPGTDVKFDVVPIPGGKFMMGSPDDEKKRKDDEGPQHEVAVEPFWMGKCEVTWEEYELWGLGLDYQRRKILKVESTERDEFVDSITRPTNPYSDMTFGMGKDGYPAICMTQLAAKIYCKWLSAKTGRYYRLPTEAEWEYACRAETTTAYCFGDDPDKLDDYGWYFDNSDDKYQKVGKREPNAWGLHDMHGNVAEWVLDQLLPQYYQTFAGKTADNPLAETTTLYPRVVRGGSWVDDPEQLRSAARQGSHKDWKMQDPQIPQSIWYLTDADFVGFRVVRPLRIPTPEEAQRYNLDAVQVTEMIDYRKAQAGKE